MHPVAVDGARARVGQVAVPDFVGELRQLDAFELALALDVEEAQLDLGRALAENSAKLTPRPSQVAPNGNGNPSRTDERWMMAGASVSRPPPIWSGDMIHLGRRTGKGKEQHVKDGGETKNPPLCSSISVAVEQRRLRLSCTWPCRPLRLRVAIVSQYLAGRAVEEACAKSVLQRLDVFGNQGGREIEPPRRLGKAAAGHDSCERRHRGESVHRSAPLVCRSSRRMTGLITSACSAGGTSGSSLRSPPRPGWGGFRDPSSRATKTSR
jgi:hypothetical protein